MNNAAVFGCTAGGLCGAGCGFVSGFLGTGTTCLIAYAVLKAMDHQNIRIKPMIYVCVFMGILHAVFLAIPCALKGAGVAMASSRSS